MRVRPTDRAAGVLLEFPASSGEVVRKVFQANINTRQYIARVDIVSPPGLGPLRVQKDADFIWSDTDLVLSFGSQPTEDNTLILCAYTPGTITGVEGWTRVVGSASGGAIYTKAAGASESQTLTINNSATSGYQNAAWYEYEPMALSAFDVGASVPPDGTPVTSRSTGTTAVTAQANELCVAMFYHTSAASTGISFTNGFTLSDQVRGLTVATSVPGAVGTQETTITVAGAVNMGGAIATFKASTPDAAPVSPRQYFSRFVEFEVPPEFIQAWEMHGKRTFAVSISGHRTFAIKR